MRTKDARTVTAIRIVNTILWAVFPVLCMLLGWGGYKPYILGVHFTYQRVSFYTYCPLIFTVIAVAACVLAIIFIWTKLYKACVLTSLLQTAIVAVNYFFLESRGSVYELGLAHLLIKAMAFVLTAMVMPWQKQKKENE